MPANADPVTTLAHLIRDVRVAMLTTMDGSGRLHSRPMAVQDQPFEGTLWFLTGRSTHKAVEIAARPQVNVSFSAPDEHRYVSVTGTAAIVDDPERLRSLWHSAYRAWFPRGLDDPDLVALRIDIDQAEYWDTRASTMVKLAGFVKAVVTGRRSQPGKHERIDLNDEHLTPR